MRAEAQAHVEKINAAMALVRRFIEWDRALRRLDELNARVEDPALWNDPKQAQAIMQERRRLDESIAAVKAIETDRDDTVELIEMAEAEGDADMEAEANASLAEKLSPSSNTSRARPKPASNGNSAASITDGMPILTSGMPNRARVVATLRSQAAATSSPAPSA